MSDLLSDRREYRWRVTLLCEDVTADEAAKIKAALPGVLAEVFISDQKGLVPFEVEVESVDE